MSTHQNKNEIIKDIIENVSTLPYECQDFLLSMSKAMNFTRNSMIKQLSSHPPQGCESSDKKQGCNTGNGQ